MRAEKLVGFVLKRTNFGEADKFITIFTREKGKIKVLAKGIRKIKSRRAPHLELFNTVEIMVYEGKTFNIVTEAFTLARPGLANLEQIGYFFYTSEVLDKLLPENQPHPESYSLLLQFLSNITETSVKKFTIELLWDLGYLPRGDYPKQGISSFVESLIEKPLKSKKFLEEL